MGRKELKEKVDTIIGHMLDDEKAHSLEDELHLEIIRTFCPDWVVAEVNRLRKVGFSRHCA